MALATACLFYQSRVHGMLDDTAAHASIVRSTMVFHASIASPAEGCCTALQLTPSCACLPSSLSAVFQHFFLSQLRVFSRVPVVVGTIINRVTCHPTDLAAKLWLDCGAGASKQQTAAAAAAGQQGGTVPSAMAFETLLED
jgi:hypothetical protein